MDILRNGSWRISFAFFLGLVLVITAMTERASLANTKTATETLVATYRSPGAIAPAEAESTVAALKRALATCGDNYLAFRIRYRIGVIYFRAGMSDASKIRFRRIADDPKCPELIRACSLNMTGQISRLGAEDKEALEAFDKVVNLVKHRLSVDKEYASNSAIAKLWCSALLSRAEIYELRKDYTAGIAEYSRLLSLSSQSESKDMPSRYAPLANDRMSQLCLRQGETDKYIQLAKALPENYPKYHRTPIVRLELECVKFLSNVSASMEFPDGSLGAPARVIACVKSSNGTISAQNVVNKLSGLCSEYQNTDGGLLLQYHYAWLLDTLGEKHKAAEIFARISSTDAATASDKSREKAISESVREYARIQYAIMAGEKADYKEALRVLSSLRAHPDKSHISELAKSVTKGIQTLKREVPANANEEK